VFYAHAAQPNFHPSGAGGESTAVETQSFFKHPSIPSPQDTERKRTSDANGNTSKTNQEEEKNRLMAVRIQHPLEANATTPGQPKKRKQKKKAPTPESKTQIGRAMPSVAFGPSLNRPASNRRSRTVGRLVGKGSAVVNSHLHAIPGLDGGRPECRLNALLAADVLKREFSHDVRQHHL
jgi:hypothetical protein